MSELSNMLTMCFNIPVNIRAHIVKLHVFNDFLGKYHVLFVTNDDRVYCVGNNYNGCLGLGHNFPVLSPETIQQLCHQNIKYFANGFDFVLAVNENNMIYGMGNNDQGQLAQKYKINKLPPEIISYLNDKNIVQLSCGFHHTLALTSDGRVYAWGCNSSGQIGCGNNKDMICTPIELPFEDFKIQSVYCCYTSSFAITSDGHVFSWGWNSGHKLGQNITDDKLLKPRLISTISGVKAMNCSKYGTYFHTTNGLYFCGEYYENNNKLFEKSPKQILCDQNIKNIRQTKSINNYDFDTHIKDLMCVSINDKIHVYCFTKENKIIETNYNNYIDYYINELKVTYNTIELNDINEITILPSNESQIQSLDVMSIDGNNASGSQLSQTMASLDSSLSAMDISDDEDQEFHNNHYIDTFDQLEEIGMGGFGTVFKVKHKIDKMFYAIKKVTNTEISDDHKHKHRVVKEVISLATVRSEYVVQYYGSWLDNNTKQLYIQMEYCPQSLRTVLETKGPAFGRQSPAEPMNIHEYYISGEIFNELLEGVQFLHELKPQIIHRDLKPDNVLVVNGFSGHNNSRRFIKLGDFGLATVHDPSRPTASRYKHTPIGTLGFVAPEVYKGRYNHKSDIYSLGVIGQSLFDIDIHATQSFAANDLTFETSIICMNELLEKMAANWKQRPECREVLATYNEWSIDRTVVTNHKEFNSVLNTLNSNENSVFYEILFYKTK